MHVDHFVLLLLGLVPGLVSTLTDPSPSTSRIRRSASASYRFHRVEPPAPFATAAPSPRARTADAGTRLQAVQTANELELGRGLRGRLALLAWRLSARFAPFPWRRLGQTTLLAVLVVATRQTLKAGVGVNPFQAALIVGCVLLEVIDLAAPDVPKPLEE
jgi:hypothetical protein